MRSSYRVQFEERVIKREPAATAVAAGVSVKALPGLFLLLPLRPLVLLRLRLDRGRGGGDEAADAGASKAADAATEPLGRLQVPGVGVEVDAVGHESGRNRHRRGGRLAEEVLLRLSLQLLRLHRV